MNEQEHLKEQRTTGRSLKTLFLLERTIVVPSNNKLFLEGKIIVISSNKLFLKGTSGSSLDPWTLGSSFKEHVVLQRKNQCSSKDQLFYIAPSVAHW